MEGHEPKDAQLRELLESFRWTQQVASRLVYDPALAADLTQDAWTRALERFGSKLPERNWLAGTLRSLAFRAGRSRQRRAYHEAKSHQQSSASTSEFSAAEVIERSEAQQLVARAVNELPHDLRVALLLHFQEGLSFAALGRELGVAKSTAAERVQLALRKLRSNLDVDAGPSAWKSLALLAAPWGAPSLPLPVPLEPISSLGAPSSAGTPLALLGVSMGKWKFAAGLSIGLALVVALAVGPSLWPASETHRAEDTRTAGLADPPDASPATSSAQIAKDVELVQAPEETSVRSEALVAAGDVMTYFAFVGRVLDEAGEGVAGARFEIEGSDWTYSTLAQEDGRFDLRLDAHAIALARRDSFELRIIGPEYLTLWDDWIRSDGTGDMPPPSLGAQEDLGDIVLHPAGVVFGQVFSSTGEVLANAEIRFDIKDPDRPDDPKEFDAYNGYAPTVTTNAEGHFRAAHLLPGEVLLRARHGLHRVNPPRTRARVFARQEVGPVILRAIAAPVLEGRVFDTEGEPLSGVYVNATGNWSITDTGVTDEEGRYRIALREDNPAEVGTYHRGWTQVSPDPDLRQGPGKLDFVLRRDTPRAEHTILVIDEETGASLDQLRVLVAAAGEPFAELETSLRSVAPVSQPNAGLPLDYTPGEHQILVSAVGYQARSFTTADHVETSPNLTLKLKTRAGIVGRLLEEGRPLVGARVFVHAVGLHLAEPRESFTAQGIARHSSVLPPVRELTSRGGYSPEYVVGLDGPPPPYRLVSFGERLGTRTDEYGRFGFKPLKSPRVNLQVSVPGGGVRELGPFTLQESEGDLGDLDLGLPASLRGRFEGGGPWNPEDYLVELTPSDKSTRLNAAGEFEFHGVQAGPSYLRLRWDAPLESEERPADFSGLPIWQLDLEMGETRSVALDLERYRTCTLDLTVRIGGKPPAANCDLELRPVDDEDRTFDLDTLPTEAGLTVTAPSLGLCHVRVRQSTRMGGWIALDAREVLDLQPASVVQETLSIPAGQVRVILPEAHEAAAQERFDLLLDSSAGMIRVRGFRRSARPATDGVEARTEATTGAVPPGLYRARLYVTTWKDDYDTREPYFSFDVEVEEGRTTLVDLRP